MHIRLQLERMEKFRRKKQRPEEEEKELENEQNVSDDVLPIHKCARDVIM